MGQQGSKSSIEARVIFHRFGAVDMYQRMGSCSAPASVIHIQRKVTGQPAGRHSPRALGKSTHHAWPQSSCDDAGGLVYVMDNPTGGVWVKPEEKWIR